MKTTAIITAAGKGTRASLNKNKLTESMEDYLEMIYRNKDNIHGSLFQTDWQYNNK